MKKILLAFDGNHFSEGAFRFVNMINEMEPVLVTGVFLQPIDYRDIIGYSGLGNATPISVAPFQTDESVIASNIRLFEERCIHAGLEFRTHRDTDLFALEELLTETRFADLMILSGELFYDNIKKEQPNDYLKKVLRQTECPVIIVPEQYTLPDKVMLAYDGKPDAVFAIKQFTYLLPQLFDWETKLITVQEDSEELPHQQLIEELAIKHFSNLTIETVHSTSQNGFMDWISKEKGYMVVAGAYGRSELSHLFKKSFLAELIEEHRVPVFIAHK
jgi:nucleotide-binding universal stress UspA family protein